MSRQQVPQLTVQCLTVPVQEDGCPARHHPQCSVCDPVLRSFAGYGSNCTTVQYSCDCTMLYLYKNMAAQPDTIPNAVYLTQFWAALLGIRTHSGSTTRGGALVANPAAVPRAELAETPGPASGSPTGRLRCSTCWALLTAAWAS